MRSIRYYVFVVTLVVLSAAILASPFALARQDRIAARGIPEISVAALPSEARTTLALIDKGGPYPYQRDGVVFGNYERRLPVHRRGYYREYTVPTPRASNRAARRIIVGAGGEFYYTDNHYRSFKRIRE